MIPVSEGFREELEKDNRAYQTVIRMALTDGNAFTFTSANLWQGSVSIEDAVSGDDTFDVGCAIINKLTFSVNNIDDTYTGAVFEGAICEVSVGLLVGSEVEMHRKGFFTVDDASYDGSLITFKCLDFMEKFDRPYQTMLPYPATLGDIVSDMCLRLGVNLATPQFNNCDYVANTKPTASNVTYREVLSWCAAIAGCFARINRDGQLEIKWYDFESLGSAESPVDLDGGIFDNGFDVSYFSDYYNTSEGMTPYRTTKNDDSTDVIPGVDWFTINGRKATDVYVSGNSWMALGYSGTGRPMPSNVPVGWEFNSQDCACYRTYRQEGEVDGFRFLKIRWEGVSYYSMSEGAEGYVQSWELFLVEGNFFIMNFDNMPSINANGTTGFRIGNKFTTMPFRRGAYGFDDTGEATAYYITGDSADGGDFTFADYYDRDEMSHGGTFSWNEDVHEVSYLFNENVALKSTTPTGVKIIYQVTDTEGNKTVETFTQGNEAFLITLTDNDFIQTSIQAQQIATSLFNRLAFVSFHKATASAVSDPTIEAGDVGIIRDFRGKYYPIIFSRTVFNTYRSQTINSNAESASKNSSYQQYTGINSPTYDWNTDWNDWNERWNEHFGVDVDGITWNYMTGADGIDYAWTLDGGQIVTYPMPKKLQWGTPPDAYVYAGNPIDLSKVTVFLDDEDVTSICQFDPEDGFVIPDALTVGSTFSIMAWCYKYGKRYYVKKNVTVQEEPATTLGAIMEDFRNHYEDGDKYNWYVRYSNSSQSSDGFFNQAGNTLSVDIFCDRHIPNNGEYYERDKSKPVGIQDRHEVNPAEEGAHAKERRARCIWYYSQTAFRVRVEAGGWLYPYTIPAWPDWHQGSGEGKYDHPGDGMIWTGWQWWLYASDVIYQWDFTAKKLGRKMSGSALFY